MSDLDDIQSYIDNPAIVVGIQQAYPNHTSYIPIRVVAVDPPQGRQMTHQVTWRYFGSDRTQTTPLGTFRGKTCVLEVLESPLDLSKVGS